MDKEFVTLLGAVIGAIAATITLWFQVSDRRERIHVAFGSLRQSISPTVDLYIRNCGKHPVHIRDYGFVLPDGRLFSLPWYWEIEGPSGTEPDDYSRGDRALAPYCNFEAGLVTGREFVGAWATTATRERPTVTAVTEGGYWRAQLACWKARLIGELA